MVNSAAFSILLVEDNDEDYDIIRWALKRLSISTPVHRCVDGDEALDFLYHRGTYAQPDSSPRPTLVLLDLSLKAIDGFEVLARIKQDAELRMIPIIIWTSTSDPKDIEISFKQGANSYMLKPMNLNKLLEAVELLNQYWFGVAVLPNTL